MTGILLLGGNGSRLFPCTRVANKQLLPLYNKPLFFYSLSTLISLGVDHVCIVARKQDIPYYKNFLIKPFSAAKCSITFVPQDEPLGIAHAISLCKKHVKEDFYYTLLGDNVYIGDVSVINSHQDAKPFVITSRVANPNQYGVLDSKSSAVIEKPTKYIGDEAVTGLYYLPHDSFEFIEKLNPSARGEYEISDVVNYYMQNGRMNVLSAEAHGLNWFDCGDFDDLLDCASLIKSIESRKGILFGDFVAQLALKRTKEINFYYVREYIKSIKNNSYKEKFKKTIDLVP